MDFENLYRSFAEDALRNAVRLGCRQRSFGDLSILSLLMPKTGYEGFIRDISPLWSRGSSLVLGYAFAPFPGSEVRYDPQEMELLLSDYGFLVYEHPEPEELARRYLPPGEAILLPGKRCLLAVKQ